MKNSKIVCFFSGGNDSVALIQWFKDHGYSDVTALFNETGWSAPSWESRMLVCEHWIKELGFKFARTHSEGMEALVRRKKGWPMPRKGSQFCTMELKITPSMAWLDTQDPDRDWICSAGIRREESQNRAQHPEWVEDSANHGGRSYFCPLVRHPEQERNDLISKTPLPVLPHRSQECYPCIYANKMDLRLLTEERILEIERIENELGFTSKGKPRVLFRPYRQMGATGIRESVRWAKSSRGSYLPAGAGCQMGFCGI